MKACKVKAAEIRQITEDESKFAGQHSDDQIRQSILRKAKDNGLPISDDSVALMEAVAPLLKGKLGSTRRPK